MHCGLAWSPDGKRLPCETYGVTDPKRNGIYTIRASDGKELTRITTNPGGEDFPLAYSPDGGQLLLSRKDPARGPSDEGALFVTPVTGGQAHRITPWGYTDDSASWSRDGRTIVFGTRGSLYRVSPEGRGLVKIVITMPDGNPPTSAFDVALAPTAARIVFSVSEREPGLYTARLDGSDVKRLTTSPTEDHHSSWSASAGY
jgi:Tol biopolymer transport system component